MFIEVTDKASKRRLLVNALQISYVEDVNGFREIGLATKGVLQVTDTIDSIKYSLVETFS